MRLPPHSVPWDRSRAQSRQSEEQGQTPGLPIPGEVRPLQQIDPELLPFSLNQLVAWLHADCGQSMLLSLMDQRPVPAPISRSVLAFGASCKDGSTSQRISEFPGILSVLVALILNLFVQRDQFSDFVTIGVDKSAICAPPQFKG